jgi:Family of unknown function (DUF6169)
MVNKLLLNLTKKELNLPCLYKVTFNEATFIYSFVTKNKILYEVVFYDSLSYFKGTTHENQIANVFSLTIFKKSDVREPFDNEVKNTIDCILQHFFIDTEKSLLYLCDTSDKKEYKRFVKFNKWHLESKYNENVTKIDDAIIDNDGLVYYSTLIFHNSNPFKKQLIDAHFEVIDVLRNK